MTAAEVRRERLRVSLARAEARGDLVAAGRLIGALVEHDRRERGRVVSGEVLRLAAAGDPVGGPMRPVSAWRLVSGR